MGGRRIFVVLFVACIAAPSPQASAQEAPSADDVRARTHFEAGRSYFEEGAYDRAREEFRRAYDLSHRAALLLNLATTNERLGDYEQAIANIQAYLRAVPDDEDRGTLERRIENLDRLRRGRAGGGAPTPPGAQSGGGGDDGLLAGAIAGYAAAGAGVVLMGVFGGLAVSEDASLRDGCGATRSCTADQVANADTFALVSDIGLGLAIAGAAAGTVLLILGLSSGGESASASIVPWLSPEGGGVGAQLRF